MPRAWQLPEHLADVLPAQARRIEVLRRQMLDQATGRGFELVIPPMLEHLESLLSGTGRELELNTFKLVDQLSGRSLGVRADTTPQAARIDAHLLNRDGVTRLCYCGPVLLARPALLHGSRELLQFGAELFGHGGGEADLEILELAIDALMAAGVDNLTLDLADARVLRGVLAGVALDSDGLQEVVAALSNKDASALDALTQRFPPAARQGLEVLLRAYGGAEVLDDVAGRLPDRPLIQQALADLRWLSSQLQTAYPGLRVGFDLGEMDGYAYYSGTRFALYGAASAGALARGGRYDEVGAVFGRSRPATGFSMDLKALSEQVPGEGAVSLVRARWSDDSSLRQVVRQLRTDGHTVVWVLPGQSAEPAGQELVFEGGQWALRPC